MRMLYREQVYENGGYATVDVFPVFRKGRSRRAKWQPTSDVQQRLNEENAIQRLARQLNGAMKKGDGWWRLTFTDETLPETRVEALKRWQAFKRRLLRYCKRMGLGEIKMAAVFHGDVGHTEGEKRLHVHIVINQAIHYTIMAELWRDGSVEVRDLWISKKGFLGVARYMIKGMSWGRVMTTRNMPDVKPRVRTGRISRADVQELYDNWDNAAAYEGRWPGYKIAEICPYFNYFNKHYYLKVYLYKEEIFNAEAV